MDDAQFDTLARTLAATETRRRLLRRLAALPVLGSILAMRLAEDEATATKRARRRKRRRKRCVRNQNRCGGRCVNLQTDPLNCGGCGQRCQLNATCTQGQCACVVPACQDFAFGFTCCPQGNPLSCSCDLSDPGTVFTDPLTCDDIPAAECPEAQRCVGPTCQACCPVGSTCDTSTGTCLR